MIMHILQVSSGDFFSTYGGGQIYVRRLVEQLSTFDDIQVSVLSFSNQHAKEDEKELRYKLYQSTELNDEQATALVRTIDPDIIHAHSHKALLCRVGKTLGIPVVVTAHHGGIVCPAGALLNADDTICQTTPSHEHCLKCYLRTVRTGRRWYPFMRQLPKKAYLALGRMLERLPFIYFITPIGRGALIIENKRLEWADIVRTCSLLIAPSEAIKEATLRCGMPQQKVTTLPHGVPAPIQTPPFPSTDKGLHFFYVGRICYVKGIHVMLEAFHALPHENVTLHLIGGSGNKTERQYEKQLQAQYESDPRIIWHGKVEPEAVADITKDFHILIAPPIYLEVFGLNIAETLAMGKPVLATRCGGAEMQIEDGINGWLVPPNAPEALQQKMEEIISIPETQLSQMAKQRHVVSLGEHCEALIRLYRNVSTTSLT